MGPYEPTEYGGFVWRGFGVKRVEKSNTRKAVPEVGVVASTSGRYQKMAEVTCYDVMKFQGRGVTRRGVTAFLVLRFLCLPAYVSAL